jgi:hypothetical protein
VGAVGLAAEGGGVARAVPAFAFEIRLIARDLSLVGKGVRLIRDSSSSLPLIIDVVHHHPKPSLVV